MTSRTPATTFYATARTRAELLPPGGTDARTPAASRELPDRAGHVRPTGSGRIEALDLVRLLAILGMMATHLLGPLALLQVGGVQGAAASAAEVLTTGIASTTFAVVGGFSLVLAARGRLAAGDRRGAVLSTMARGALVIAIGMVLGFVPTSVVVVLVPYGVTMILAAPLLLVRSRWLLAIAGGLALTGGFLNASVRGSLGIVQEIGAVTPLNLLEPLPLLRGLALTGMYPVITWLPYMLLGIVLMRSLAAAIEQGRARSWSLRAAGIGALVAAAAYGISAAARTWATGQGIDPILVSLSGFGAPVTPELWALASASPHTGSPIDMIATSAVAIVLIGLMTLVVRPGTALRSRPARAARAAGAAPLTIYAIHVILTGAALIAAMLLNPAGDFTSYPWYVAGLGILAIHVVIALGIGAHLAARGRSGPLERLVSGIVRRVVPMR
ncbi:heparan-alpha-glucosaminide N-acetyltransferase domain-containing protein [Brachybacterium hainanense]|uniref:Heparan-alpha-glucosaminide N-acetyltransferase domain-containing protein n=1 Tax=Brachybacterium hainanense TaxID=1541174 RepID=A0ABV6R8B9_9MICO